MLCEISRQTAAVHNVAEHHKKIYKNMIQSKMLQTSPQRHKYLFKEENRTHV